MRRVSGHHQKLDKMMKKFSKCKMNLVSVGKKTDNLPLAPLLKVQVSQSGLLENIKPVVCMNRVRIDVSEGVLVLR